MYFRWCDEKETPREKHVFSSYQLDRINHRQVFLLALPETIDESGLDSLRSSLSSMTSEEKPRLKKENGWKPLRTIISQSRQLQRSRKVIFHRCSATWLRERPTNCPCIHAPDTSSAIDKISSSVQKTPSEKTISRFRSIERSVYVWTGETETKYPLRSCAPLPSVFFFLL